MIRLLDVNVLIALAWPNHVHHDAAGSWFARLRRTGWATCALATLDAGLADLLAKEERRSVCMIAL